MASKICAICGIEKDFDEFWNNKHTKDGKRYSCKECDTKKTIKYKQENYLRTKILGLICRANKYNIPHDSFDDLYNYLKPIYDKGECEKCGRKLEHGIGKGKQDSPSPSIDQITPNGGYILGNIALLCNKCNGAKSENTYEDLINWILWYENKKGIKPSIIKLSS